MTARTRSRLLAVSAGTLVGIATTADGPVMAVCALIAAALAVLTYVVEHRAGAGLDDERGAS